jgi:Uncharacterised nucleotidyltransferase
MNRLLAEAVIATFREDDVYGHKQLAGFGIRVWRRSLRWLDATGLALYFLDRLKSFGLEDAVPLEVITGLETRLADNKQRAADLFDEFRRINRAFQDAGLRYVNLKGFTLVPDYCPDPSLRCQFDLDFLASSADAPRCRDILERFGYVITGHSENVLEFKAGSAQVPSIHDLYKTKPQRSVEVHFVSSGHTAIGFEGGLLARSQSHTWSGAKFPALSDTDLFIAQAHHLFRHVKSEWTRISWLLEFKTCVAARRKDTQFWNDVRLRATTVAAGTLAVGVTTWLATEAFGEFGPRELTNWSMGAIPHPVRLWLECYGTEVLLADFPGTKLYLLLNGELSREGSRGNDATLRKVFPLHGPPRVTSLAERGIGRKVRAAFVQTSYVLFRLRFHIAESSRYLLEARRWKRIVIASGWNADRVCPPRLGSVSVGSAPEN